MLTLLYEVGQQQSSYLRMLSPAVTPPEQQALALALVLARSVHFSIAPLIVVGGGGRVGQHNSTTTMHPLLYYCYHTHTIQAWDGTSLPQGRAQGTGHRGGTRNQNTAMHQNGVAGLVCVMWPCGCVWCVVVWCGVGGTATGTGTGTGTGTSWACP